MEPDIFTLALIIEGVPEKVSQFIVPLISICNIKTFVLENKMYFWTSQNGENVKHIVIITLLMY